MKRKCYVLLTMVLVALMFVSLAQAAEEKALTLMVYMCGSNLESEGLAASIDIQEMIESGVNTDKVNVLIMTGGSRFWYSNQDPETTLIWKIDGFSANVEWAGKAMNMGDPSTLGSFVSYGVDHYPARNYALILWDHGGGPLSGICFDDLQDGDSLTMDELNRALRGSSLPKKLSWIGFDACLMSSIEVAKTVAPYARYMIASQETEPGTGWDYRFLHGIERDLNGGETGRRIVDAYFESTASASGLTLSCLDLSQVDRVTEAMNDLFRPLSQEMDAELFGRLSRMRTASVSFGKAARTSSTSSYDLVDLGNLLSHYDDQKHAKTLENALEDLVVYSRSEGVDASGISIYHPIRNKLVYMYRWAEAYDGLNFVSGYQEYVKAFARILLGRQLADWSGVRLQDDGLNQQEDNVFSIRMNESQQQNFSSAQLVVLAMTGATYEGATEIQLTETGVSGDLFGRRYFPVSMIEATLGEDGTLQAGFSGTSLYLMDQDNHPIAGPISYDLAEDGSEMYILTYYQDRSGHEETAPAVRVMYSCEKNPETGMVNITGTYVYDRITETYSRRIPFNESDYTDLWIDRMVREIPETNGLLPGMESWEASGAWNVEVQLPLQWHLQFIDEQLSGLPLYATMEITDTQQNTFCTPLVRVENPNLHALNVLPQKIAGADFEITLHVVQDTSQLNPGVTIGAELKNTSNETLTYNVDEFVFNGNRSVGGYNEYLYYGDMAPGESKYSTCRLDGIAMADLDSLNEMSFEVRSRSKKDYKDHAQGRFSCRLEGSGEFQQTEGDRLLGEVTENDITWQLISLEKNARGGVDGMLRVMNNQDREVNIYGNAVINNCIQTDDRINVNAQPHSDIYVPFEIQDRAVTFELLKVGGSQTNYTLALDHLLELYGIEQIESIKLCMYSYSHSYSVFFPLETPIPFATRAEIEQAQAETAKGEERLLLDGEISANVDRVMIAENGVSIRVTLRNYTDRDIHLTIDNKVINNHSASASGSEKYFLGAGADCVVGIGFKTFSDEKAKVRDVESIGMTFRFEDYTTTRAYIRLNHTARMEKDQGKFLSPFDFSVEPTTYNRPAGVDIIPRQVTIADTDLSFAMEISNNDNRAPEDQLFNTDKIVLKMHVVNSSQGNLEYSMKDFILNDIRYQGEESRGFTMNLKPGDSEDEEIELKALGLTDLNEITSIAFTLSVEPDGKYSDRTEYPVRIELSGCDISRITQKSASPMCETTKDGITWKLYSMEENEEGTISGLMYINNQNDTPLEGKDADIMMEGVHCLGILDATLPPHTERFSKFRYFNDSHLGYQIKAEGENIPKPYISNILQKLGINSVSSMTVLINMSELHGTVDQTFTLKLPREVQLSPADKKEIFGKGTALVKGDDISVSVIQALAGDKGVSLTLLMKNETARPVLVQAINASTGGRIITDNDHYCLPARSTRVDELALRVDSVLSDGEKYKEITLSFLVDGEYYQDAVVTLGKAFTLNECEILYAGKIGGKAGRLVAAPVLREKILTDNPTHFRAIQLEAPVSRQETENFDYGYAIICSRGSLYTKNDEGEKTEHSCLREYAGVPLSFNKGRLLARYSGALLNGRQMSHLGAVETPKGSNAAQLHMELVMFTADQPLEGDFPEEGISGLDHGILVQYDMNLQYGKKISASGLKCRITDLATGQNLKADAIMLDQIGQIYSGNYVRVTDDPSLSGVDYTKWEAEKPKEFLIQEAESYLEDRICVLYEIHDKNGIVTWIEDEYP